MQVIRRAYVLNIDTNDKTLTLTLTPAGGGEPMLRLRWPLLLVPEFAGQELATGPVSLTQASQPGLADGVLQLRAPLAGGGELRNTIYLLDDRLVCEASYRLDTDHAVRHWHIAPPGSTVAVDRLQAIIGRRGEMDTKNGIEFSPADADMSTAGHNFMFAVSGPRIVLRRGGTSICLGGTALANDFGINCRLKDNAVEHLRFDYGGDIPFHLPGGRTHLGPRLQVLFTDEPEYERVHGQFVDAMYDDGIIDRNRYGPEHAVFRRPVYCTWGDQVHCGKALKAGIHWKKQRTSNVVLDETLVRRAVDQIRKYKLNIGSITIDAGWQDKRGDWNMDTKKFPNFRGLVDDLHAMGFKVRLWWAPIQIEEGAAILRERKELTAGPTRNNEWVYNYENPATREHITRIIHRFFDSGPDGYDLDGLKLDWLIEKVYPQPGYNDPAWRGEERCICSIYRLVNEIGRAHKRVIMIEGGVADNPHMATYSHWCGAEERFDHNLDVMEVRARLYRAIRPGMWLKNHLAYDPEVSIQQVKLIKAAGGIPEIGIVLPENIQPDTMQRLAAVLAT